MIMLMSSCVKKTNMTYSVSRFQQLLDEKEKLSIEYSQIIKDPIANRDKINDIDKKMHEINNELKILRKKPDVMEYAREQFKRQYGGSETEDTPSTETSRVPVNSDLDYDVNQGIDFDDKESNESTTIENAGDFDDDQLSNELESETNRDFADDTNDYETEMNNQTEFENENVEF